MAVSTTINRLVFSGNSSTTDFSFPEYITAKADVVVIQTDSGGTPTLKTLTTDYTIALTTAVNGAYPTGCTVTMLVAPPTGTKLTIYRDTARTQPTHWTDNDPMPSSTLETAMDRATLLAQRNADLLARAVLLNDGFTTSFNMTLPNTLAAGLALVVNAAGNGWDTTAITAAGFGTPVSAEVPSGVLDSSNLTYTLAHTPKGTMPFFLFIDGLRETNFTRSGATITMGYALSVIQTIIADYNY